MQIIGVDFGTTNVRIASWDSDREDVAPSPLLIGQGNASTMPAVIAFRHEPGGGVSTVVGEDAILLEDAPDGVVLVDNIKRWALAADPYVKWHLESRGVQAPSWWDPETRSVNVWDQEFPVKEVIRLILAEAFRRANISGEFEWRAGCPVHAGLDYRSELAEVLSGFGGVYRVASIIEEPVLFLELALRLGKLQPGSYLVYDLGGGSFDCALSDVGEDGQMTVYSAQGNPLLGGVTIDGLLSQRLGYTGTRSSLTLAKEQLSPTGEPRDLNNGFSLTWTDFVEALDKAQFLGWSLATMREAYISAKAIWKRGEGAYPVGGSPMCRLESLPQAFGIDLDRIILTGGPTKSPYFRERLKEMFGSGRVVAADDVVPQEIPDPELTCLSMGACYMATRGYSPLYVNRLPVRVTLQNTQSGVIEEYKPFSLFGDFFNPAKPFISKPLPSLGGARTDYVLTVADGDGVVLERKGVVFGSAEKPGDSAMSPQLVIDTFGRVGILNDGNYRVEMESPVWQTEQQREILREFNESMRVTNEKRDARKLAEKNRVHRMLTENPFGWQGGHD